VNGWPLSTVDGETEITGTTIAGLTVTVTVAVALPPTESVARTQYWVVDASDGVVKEAEDPRTVPTQPVPRYHAYNDE
jgi:hypothetical protein